MAVDTMRVRLHLRLIRVLAVLVDMEVPHFDGRVGCGDHAAFAVS